MNTTRRLHSETPTRVSKLVTGFVAAAVLSTVAVGCSVETESSDSSTSSALSYDANLGNRVANVASRREGYGSGNWCLKEVGDSLDIAGIRPTFPRLESAAAFDNWARSNPGAVAQRGYQLQSVDSIDAIPRGSIITWRPGQCGYHSVYGHIEIVTGSNRACSDYCGSIKRGCGMPGVFVPVGNGNGGGGGGGGGNGACSVNTDDHKLYCPNRVTSLYRTPSTSSAVVNTLRSTNSWFTCWTTGDLHAGGNTTWYQTVGDDNGNAGYAPAVALSTPNDFDGDPSAHGLPKCQ